MIEVQCTSCHTRYRIDEQVLPEGLPTFKCSRCGHVFSCEPRKSRASAQHGRLKPEQERTAEPPDDRPPSPATDEGQAPAAQAKEFPNHEQAAPATPSPEVPPGFDEMTRPESSAVRRAPSAASGERRLANGLGPQERTNRSGTSTPATSVESPRSNSKSSSEPAARVAAEEARKFYSRLFTGSEPDNSGENLSFDFTDEEPEPNPLKVSRRSRRPTSLADPPTVEGSRWRVGDDEFAAPGAVEEKNFRDDTFGDETPRRSGGRRRRQRAELLDDEFIDEAEAPIYNRGIIHSSRFFILLIFLIALGFGALTLLIHNAPAASASVLSYLPLVGDRFTVPTTPAKLVALRDVDATYQVGKGPWRALVISGTAENVGTEPLHLVQLSAGLRDLQRRLVASGSAYCGNSVSPGMVGQMTPHEIDFLQKLEPAKNFVLEPSTTCRFVIVLMNPSATAHSYEVSVSQAIPVRAPNFEQSAS